MKICIASSKRRNKRRSQLYGQKVEIRDIGIEEDKITKETEVRGLGVGVGVGVGGVGIGGVEGVGVGGVGVGGVEVGDGSMMSGMRRRNTMITGGKLCRRVVAR